MISRNHALGFFLLRLDRATDPARAGERAAAIVAGMWERWEAADEPTMDAPVGAALWAKRLSCAQVERLALCVEAEHRP